MTSSVRDVLWPEPRIALLYPPGFSNLSIVEFVIGQPEIQGLLEPPGVVVETPEILTLKRDLGDYGPIERWLRYSPWPNSSVIAKKRTADAYEAAVAEILDYATHVIFFWDGTDELLSLIKKHGHDIKLKAVRLERG